MKTPRGKNRRKRASKMNLTMGILAFASVVCVLFYPRPSSVEVQTHPPPSHASATKEFTLIIAGAISPSLSGVLVALSDGLFQLEGLSVRLQRGKDSTDVVTTVAANDHAIGIASAQAFLEGRAD